MTTPTQQQLDDATTDLANIAQVGNADEATTITMRLGRAVRSVAKAVADVYSAGIAGFGDLFAARDSAAASASQATTAANAAIAAGRVYATTSAGISGTTTGQYFMVQTTVNTVTSLELYLNSSGTAIDQNFGFNDLRNSVQPSAAYEGILSQLLGPNDEFQWQVGIDGKFYANLAINVGVANGLTFVFDPSTKQSSISLGTTQGILPLNDWQIDSTFQCEGVTFQILGPNNEIIYQQFIDGTSTGASGVALTTVISQLAAAAGSQIDLATRLNNGLDAQGVPLHHIFGNGYLREIRSRIRQRLLGMATVINIVIGPGDSYSDFKDIWSTNFATFMRTLLGSAGHGWTGFGYPNAGGNVNYQRGNAFPAEVTVNFSGGGWTGQFTSVTGSPDLSSATSSNATDTIHIAKLVGGDNSVVKLHYIPGAGTGVIQYRWNSGSWTALNLSSVSGAGAAVSLASVPTGAWTLDLQVVSGSCQLCGIDLQETGPGVRVHNLANNGSAAVNWANNVTQSELALAWARLGQVNLFLSLLGTNDQGQGWSYAQFGAAYNTLVATMLSASPATDRLLLCPAENGRGLSLMMTQYAIQQRVVAKNNKVCQANLQQLFGDTIADYRFSNSNRSALRSDDLHPNDTWGGPAILDFIIRLITTTA